MEYELIDHIYHFIFGSLAAVWVFLCHYLLNLSKLRKSWIRIIPALILPVVSWYVSILALVSISEFLFHNTISDTTGMEMLFNGICIIGTSIMGIMLIKCAPEKYLKGLVYFIFLLISSLAIWFFWTFHVCRR